MPGQFSDDLSWLGLRAGALIGRVDELADLTTMLTRPEAWIVTVTGSAGVAIYHKTGVRGRAAATAWAYRNGYVASGA